VNPPAGKTGSRLPVLGGVPSIDLALECSHHASLSSSRTQAANRQSRAHDAQARSSPTQSNGPLSHLRRQARFGTIGSRGSPEQLSQTWHREAVPSRIKPIRNHDMGRLNPARRLSTSPRSPSVDPVCRGPERHGVPHRPPRTAPLLQFAGDIALGDFDGGLVGVDGCPIS
jgi:hypothetical protein